MNTYKLLLGSAILAMSTAAPSSSNSLAEPVAQTCQSYSYNRCNFDADSGITTTFGVDDEYCQFLCGDSSCKYFIYDYIEERCEVYGSLQDPTFSSYCKVHGGPIKPTLDTCKNETRQNDPCKVIWTLQSF